MTAATSTRETRPLARQLRTPHAVVVGLGAMIGAGAFSAAAPAARAAGAWVLTALLLAAIVAALNATSSARLAARHPTSGGAYAWARAEGLPTLGFVAGVAFVVGKTASMTAMALVFGHAVAPSHPRAAAMALVVAAAAANVAGVKKSVAATAAVLLVVVPTLLVVAAACWTSDGASLARALPSPTAGVDVRGLLAGGAYFFFAFAGYARIATLGEEVVDPARTIPRATAIALLATFALYALVVGGAVAVVGPAALGASAAPLVTAVEGAGRPAWAVVARVGAIAATAGVIVSLSLGVGRTIFAAARDGEAPRFLADVRAAVVASAVAVVALIGAGVDLAGAIGGSSTLVLVYYACAHATAWRARSGRVVAAVGAVACVALASSLPWRGVALAAAVLGAAIAARAVLGTVRRRRA